MIQLEEDHTQTVHVRLNAHTAISMYINPYLVYINDLYLKKNYCVKNTCNDDNGIGRRKQQKPVSVFHM